MTHRIALKEHFASFAITRRVTIALVTFLNAWVECLESSRERQGTRQRFGRMDVNITDASERLASQLHQRINLFCALSDEKLEPIAIRRIGEQLKIENEKELPR